MNVEALFEGMGRIEMAIAESIATGMVAVVRHATADEIAYAEVCGYDGLAVLPDGSLDLFGPSVDGEWRIRVVPE